MTTRFFLSVRKTSFYWLPTLALVALIGQACERGRGPTKPTPVEPTPQDAFDALRLRVQEMMLGKPGYDAADPDIAASVEGISIRGQELWDQLLRERTPKYPFADNPTQFPNTNIAESYRRVRDMARAYATPGGSLYMNPALHDDLLGSLEWLFQNWYNTSISKKGPQSPENNWFEWELGVPLALGDILLYLYDELTPEQIKGYTDVVRYFNPKIKDTGHSVGGSWGNSGANLAWKSAAMLKVGILTKDGELLGQVRDALSPLFEYSVSGDGFYQDGSFIQHTNHPYTIGYGFGHLGSTVENVYALAGSPWEVTDPNLENIHRWIWDSFEPLIFNCRMPDNLVGRTLSRIQGLDHVGAVVNSSLLLARLTTDAQSALYRQLVKHLVLSDPTFTFVGRSVASILALREILQDSSIQPFTQTEIYKQFPAMDRFVMRRNGYAFSVGMYSDRIANYEQINYENLQGWHTNDGRFSLYDGDYEQFDDYYWATIDSYRLPGITVKRSHPEDVMGPQVGKVLLEAGKGPEVDELTDWSQIYAHTQSWVMTKGELDSDPSRIARKLDTSEELIYQLPGLRSFEATIYVRVDRPMLDRINAYRSEDGLQYRKLKLTVTEPQAIENGWAKVLLSSADNFGDKTTYLKLEFLTLDSPPARTSDRSFVGGVDLGGLYGVSGMDLHPVEETLEARKSWFMFDDEIVLLGSNINSRDNRTIETVVDNQRIRTEGGNNRFLVNGAEMPGALGWSGSIEDVKWANVEGNVPGSDTGYFFPEGGTLQALREARTASLSEVTHANSLNDETVTRNFLTFWFDHGVNPTASKVAYVLLPGRTPEETQAYAEDPDITIVAHTEAIHAVRENRKNILAANFWKDELSEVDLLRVNRAASVIVRESDGKIELAISDPTQRNNAAIDVQLSRSARSVVSADPAIYVYQLEPTIRFTVNTRKAAGRSIKASFDLVNGSFEKNPATRSPEAPLELGDEFLNNKLLATSANVFFESGGGDDPERFRTGNGDELDLNRIKRRSPGESSLVYQFEGLTDFSLRFFFDSYTLEGLPPLPQVFVASNPSNWIPVPSRFDEPVVTGKNGTWRRSVLRPASPAAIPRGMSFIKIVMPAVLDPVPQWNPLLGRLDLTRLGSQCFLIDPLDDYSRLFSTSTGWVIDSTAATERFQGDLGRFRVSSAAPQEIVYRSDRGFESFSLVVFAPQPPATAIRAYVSDCGHLWSPIELKNVEAQAGVSGWPTHELSPAQSLPDWANYLRFELASDTPESAPQLGSVTLFGRC